MSKVMLRDVCSKGSSNLRQKDVANDGPFPVVGASGVIGSTCTYQFDFPYLAVVKDGAGVGRVIRCEAKSSILGTMQAIIPGETVSLEYLQHLLSSMNLSSYASGATIPHIYFKDYGKATIPVPSLEEQEKISIKLDRPLDLIESCRTQLVALDELVKSRFIEMFGEADNFQRVPLSECVLGIDSGKSPKCTAVPRLGKQPAVLKLSAISSGAYLESENKALLPEEQIVQSKEVEAGDILMTRKNTPELVGMCVLVRETKGNVMFPDLVFRMHPTDKVDGTYLSNLLSGPMFSEVREMAHGSAKSMSNIPKSELGNLPIPVPPLALQQQFADFVAKVDKFVRKVDKLEFAGLTQVAT